MFRIKYITKLIDTLANGKAKLFVLMNSSCRLNVSKNSTADNEPRQLKGLSVTQLGKYYTKGDYSGRLVFP